MSESKFEDLIHKFMMLWALVFACQIYVAFEMECKTEIQNFTFKSTDRQNQIQPNVDICD